MTNQQEHISAVSALDALQVLAYVGDLSMGQPVEHSVRTAWLAVLLANSLGTDSVTTKNVGYAALLRWSGCTANAPEFADLLGDDVTSRRELLAIQSDVKSAKFLQMMQPLAVIHCEVAETVARMLNLSVDVQSTLKHCFEFYDGSGLPNGLGGDGVYFAVYLINLAGDFEVLTRTYGLEKGLQIVSDRANHRYPADFVTLISKNGANWLNLIDKATESYQPLPPQLYEEDNQVQLELIADVIDLKIPWMLNFSKQVADTAKRCAYNVGLDLQNQNLLYRAGLLHGIGRASVPNRIFESGSKSSSEQEKLRLVPYWTQGAGRRIKSLQKETSLASFTEERLDGSGYFRGIGSEGLSLLARIMAVASRTVTLQTERPGAYVLDRSKIETILRREADAGLLDTICVDAVISELGGITSEFSRSKVLTNREIQILTQVSRGETNKMVARSLGISPSTVRTHMESIFRKLECTTRATATLKAATMGLI
jgi:response regulator RpfG family c-di-GMP phosphodiesterase